MTTNLISKSRTFTKQFGVKLTLEDFITRSRALHGNKYDYSLVVYVNGKTKVKIICPEHGEFYQTPDVHFSRGGCKKCATALTVRKNKLTTEDFVKRAISIHGDTYDYSKVVYKNAITKVDIICKTHGVFSIAPNNHCALKQGCKQCGQVIAGKKKTIPFEVFVQRAREVHGNKFEYNKFKGGKIVVVCSVHGEFEQRKRDHLSGAGCKPCSIADNGFGRSNFEKHCERNSEGIGTLYLIKCFNDEEVFYKIGITSRKVSLRFNGKLPYSYKTLKTVKAPAKSVFDLETSLQRMSKDFKYSPKLSFKGEGECFSDIPDDVLRLLSLDSLCN